MPTIFTELAMVFVVVAMLAVILGKLRQPSIIAYIFAGAILGPYGLGIINQGEILSDLSRLGITLLLFLVGLELNGHDLKRYGRNAILAGIAQITITALIGIAIARALNFNLTESAYIGLALTFSSTILVIKLLSEKRQLQSLSGRLVIGIFLTQDIIALLLLILLSGTQMDGSATHILFTLLKGGILVAGAWLVGNKILSKLLRKFSQSDEITLVLALAWGLGLAALANSHYFNFSLEIGGFLAGLTLARSLVQHQINHKVKALRDFFLVLFFVLLGGELIWGEIFQQISTAAWLTGFVLVGNPIIVTFILGILGYQPRTAFLAAITVGQVSEFSLILATTGKVLGHISNSTFSLLALVSIASMIFSSYFITHSETIYSWIKPILDRLPIWQGKTEHHQQDDMTLNNHVIIAGAHQVGAHLVEMLWRKKFPFVLVDFNPEVVENFNALGIKTICGDITDPEIQRLAGLSRAKLIVSTMPDKQDNISISENAKSTRKKPKVIVSCHSEKDASELYASGIDYVFLPDYLSSAHIAHIIGEKDMWPKLKGLREKYKKLGI